MTLLGCDFFLSSDVVELSKQLLGKKLCTFKNNILTSGQIIETEAYRGPDDRACHAYNNRRTPRTEVMFKKGGICYVYLCYGIHHLLNIVTGEENIPHAILIRAIRPIDGIEEMVRRRGKKELDASFTGGPGMVTLALGIDKKENGVSLNSNTIWIEEADIIDPENIWCGPRVGIDYAGPDAMRPWRFKLKE